MVRPQAVPAYFGVIVPHRQLLLSSNEGYPSRKMEIGDSTSSFTFGSQGSGLIIAGSLLVIELWMNK
jgi:hypothetical protein